jgi:hypothetical protein
MVNEFVVFVITHGRPGCIATEATFRNAGYSGPIYFVVDDEDRTRKEYYDRFGSQVVEFCKSKYSDMVDEGDNFNDRRTTTHARNACFDIAERLGYKWFLVLDDDYTGFEYRTDSNGLYPRTNYRIRSKADKVIASVLRFYQNTDMKTVAMAQGGDFMGGHLCETAENPTLKRKAMNTFFCCTKRRFWFRSRLNEDVNTYLALGFIGDLLCTTPLLSIVQKQTQKTKGGMSETYLESGTYVKSFYSVVYAPHSVKVSMIGTTQRRIHHRINWSTAVPRIVAETERKNNDTGHSNDGKGNSTKVANT